MDKALKIETEQQLKRDILYLYGLYRYLNLDADIEISTLFTDAINEIKETGGIYG